MSQAPDPDSPSIQAFKDFLSHRPIVREVLFRHVTYPTHGGDLHQHEIYLMPNEDGTYRQVSCQRRSDPVTTFFYAAWQPGAFILREIPPLAPASPAPVADPKRRHLQFGGFDGETHYQVSRDLILKSKPNSDNDLVRVAALALEDTLHTLLSFGIWGARVNSFLWEGPHFRGELNYLEKLQEDLLQGKTAFWKLEPTKEGWVQSASSPENVIHQQPPLQGHLVMEDGKLARVDLEERPIQCFYQWPEREGEESNPPPPASGFEKKDLPLGIPRHIKVVHGGHETHGEYEIYSLTTSDHPLPREHFQPERFVSPDLRLYGSIGPAGTYEFVDRETRKKYMERLWESEEEC